MAIIVDYIFKDTRVTNPDGSVPTTLPSDTRLVDGPGSFQGQDLPKAARVGFSGPIAADISAVPIPDTSRFHARVVFRIDAAFNQSAAPKDLFACGRLPFSLILHGQTDSFVKLVGSVRSSTVQWRGTEAYYAAKVTPGEWHTADLVYDVDTLVVLLDGVALSCHGFGSNGTIPLFTNQKSVFIGGEVLQSRLIGDIAAFKLQTTITPELETLIDQQRQTAQWYITTKLETNRLAVDLGQSTAAPAFDFATSNWSQPYTNGLIMYHSEATAAYEMYGLILVRYRQLSKAVQDSLGFLASDEMPTTTAGGRKNVFQGGAIYWSPSTPALEILGQTYLQYESTGETATWGFPVEAAQNISGGISQRTQFAVWYLKTGAPTAHEVHGQILALFQQSGGIGKWGFPTSNETVVPGLSEPSTGPPPVLSFPRNVRLSTFERCSIYWSPTTGAHILSGDILTKYLNGGGPTSSLGLPTTDEVSLAGGNRSNGFENGAIVFLASSSTAVVAKAFRLFVGVLNTKESEGAFMGENDIYFRVTINRNGNGVIFSNRYPGSGDFGGRNILTFNQQLDAIMVPQPSTSFTFIIDVWDSDGGAPFGGGDDHLGTWTKVLDASNAWGFAENQGILDSGNFDKINNISAAIHPVIDPKTLTEDDKFFAADNQGTDSINYQIYAEAFRNIDSEPEKYDILDGLDKLFYNLVVKGLDKNGNCFGMVTEAIYARLGWSIFPMPIHDFANFATIQHAVNVKHCYQVGASSVWFFVGQFLSGSTHNPADVFSATSDGFANNAPPTLNLSQNYNFSGKPHVVMAVAWNRNVTPATIKIHDPSEPGPLRELTVDFGANRFRYSKPTATYEGGQWSGGRLYYTPLACIDSVPRTPLWDAIVLLIVGTIVILGDGAKTTSMTDANGNDIDAHGSRATTALQNRQSLNGYFVKKTVAMDGGDDFRTEMLFTRGRKRNLPIISPPGPIPHLPGAPTPAPAPPPASTAAATAAEGATDDASPPPPPPLPTAPLTPRQAFSFSPSTSFKHTARAGANTSSHTHVVKTGPATVSLTTTPFRAGESATVGASALGTASPALDYTYPTAAAARRRHAVGVAHRLGMGRDAVQMEFAFAGVTAAASGAPTPAFRLRPRPGLGIVDLVAPSPHTRLVEARLTLTVVRDQLASAHSFDLGEVAAGAGLRVKTVPGSRAGRVVLAKVDAAGKVVGESRAVQGRAEAENVRIRGEWEKPPVTVPK